MKKVLFATTALIATASMAAADVRISGYGRFGLDYNEANKAVVGRSTSNITSRLRLQFDMSAESDNGIAFGARYRIQSESRDGIANTAVANGGRFFLSSGGFTLQVGNILGALENMPGTYLETRTAGAGIDGAGFTSHVGNLANAAFKWDAYSSAGAGRNGVEVLGSVGDFRGHISYSRSNDTAAVAAVTALDSGGDTYILEPATAAAIGVERTAINLAYSFGDWNAAIGYQDSNVASEDKTIVSVWGDLGQFGVRAAYADNDGVSKWGLYGNMDIGAASNILIFVVDESATSAADIANGHVNNVGNGEGTGYGIHYSYDLGGGASFEAAIVENSKDMTTAQAGVYFAF